MSEPAADQLQQQQQVEQGEQASTTCFTDLPDAVLGLIWARLDPQTQLAFLKSCRAVWASPAVNATFQDLRISWQWKAPDVLDRLLAFPRHATLRRLHISTFHDFFWQLIELVLESEGARDKLRGLLELEVVVGVVRA